MADLTPYELDHLQKGMTEQQKSAFTHHFHLAKKDRLLGFILSWFVGQFGVDRFYVGDMALGVGKLVTFGGCGLWWLVDLFLIMNRVDQWNREKAYEIAYWAKSQGGGNLPAQNMGQAYEMPPTGQALETDGTTEKSRGDQW